MDRRNFLKHGLAAGAALALGGCAAKTAAGPAAMKRTAAATPAEPSLVAVAAKGQPADLTRRAIEALGGMGRFVTKGQTVVIKPNLAWQRTAEQAANTNPEVVGTLIRLCREAGAGRVTVIEHTIDTPARLVFDISGMQRAVDEAGGELVSAHDEGMYAEIPIPGGRLRTRERVIRQVLEADVFINVPIAKVHGSTKLTLGMKNLMGVIWDRGAWHNSESLHTCIAEFAGAVRPDLVVVDAWRVMLTRGPKGPGETKDLQTVLASTDQVAADAYATGFFGMKPADIEFVRLAGVMGHGHADLAKIKVKHA